MIGQTISHYRILEKLGEGGMAEVYLAEDTVLGRRVALKVLRPEIATSGDSEQRFLHEAKAVASLSHANIVTLFEFGEAEGRSFLAMEFVDGHSLEDEVDKKERRIDDAIESTLSIANGLIAAHDAGIVHRDLKPANILLSKDGTIKISDFGLAQLRGASGLTKTGTVMGTLSYMSPEQIEGKKVDHRADVFSLGVILYELICGQRPFQGESDPIVMYEILSSDPQPMARYSRDASDELERVVQKALAKVAADRYQSVAEFASELQAILDVRQKQAPSTGQLQKPKPEGRRISLAWVSIPTVAFVALVTVAWWLWSTSSQESRAGTMTLVVLPLKNHGSADQEYFADGLTDELTSKIGRMHGLSVISHTSAMVYKNANKTAREICDELNADFLLEGAVRWSKSPDGIDKVRVTPRLISAEDNTELWNATYDDNLADVFAVQSAIAEQVAEELGVALFEDERRLLNAGGTENLEAYDFYLQANDYFRRGFLEDDVRASIELYERAVAADSSFALAQAQLAVANAKMYWWGYEHTPEQLEYVRQLVDRVMALDPDLPEAHLAKGYFHYWCQRDYDKALTEFATARIGQPNSSDLVHAIGLVQRRSGDFDSALVNLQKAVELDPRAHNKAYELGNTLYRLRRWNEAEGFLDRAIALAPDWYPPYGMKVRMYVYADSGVARARFQLDMASLITDKVKLSDDLVWLHVLAGDYQSALDTLQVVDEDVVWYNIQRGMLLRYLGQDDEGIAALESARATLQSWVDDEPNTATLHRYLGLTLAYMGRNKEAIAAGRRALKLLPVDKDAFFGGPSNLETLAQIYAMCGETERAISELKRLVELPAGLMTIPYIQLAPEFEAVRAHPEFQELVEQYQSEETTTL